eukprot:2906795-Alexandrium_andersonii.AAC.1
MQDDVMDYIAQAPGVEFQAIRGFDAIPEDCHVNVPTDLGADVKLRPLDGHYLARPARAALELTPLESPEEAW